MRRRLTIRSTGHIAAYRHLPRHFILGQMAPRRNVPVSSNVSHHEYRTRKRTQYRDRSLLTKWSFLVLKTFATRSNATLVQPGEASSLLALRAAALSAGPVQQPAARSAAGRVPSASARFVGAKESGRFSGDCSAMKVGPKLSNTERRFRSRSCQARAPKTRKHLSVVVVGSAKFKSTSVIVFPMSGGSAGRVLANHSLNRTLCGGPRLAIISFLAKPGPPQSAG